MTESVPGYHDHPYPPAIDRAQLRIRIALFLQSGAGDPAARDLLEQAQVALLQADAAAQCVGHCHQYLAQIGQAMIQHFDRIETALTAVENLLISDGK